ncbi:MAG TPA: D-glycero-beta-D-manno-heptose-7-phosphate kinase [Elusimicrobiota bacterium]|nr:D-glycero-beta-D-manno-heptose-7-phosphate kinase [Elusimicrobiota bacterium]
MDIKRLATQVRRLKNTPVMVIGDMMVDRYLQGEVHRLSPEAPVPVVDVSSEKYMPGGAGNVASNIASLGGRPVLVSVVGADQTGERLLRSLSQKGVRVEGVCLDGDRPTTIKTRVMAGHQQVVRFDKESRTALSRAVTERLMKFVSSRIRSVNALLISDYGKGVINEAFLAELLPMARRHKKLVTVDPKIEHFLRYRQVDCLTPNVKEATEGIRALPPKSQKDLERIGRDILSRLKSRSVLVTQGEKGMTLFRQKGLPIHIPTMAKEVFDVTGAGDTVISVLTLALAAGFDLVEAAYLSNVAAGLVVAKLGTAVVTQEEIVKVLK